MSDTFDRLKTALADRYAIEREIGSGGMATVYLARDLKHERLVAIKVLRPELAAALGPDRFLQEIKIAANLNHPHILPLLDSGSAEEQPTAVPPDRRTAFLYYVMPFIEGESLREKLAKEGELPITEAVRILRDVVDALCHAHKHNVVHRDIKPDNVMLSDRHALVTDFGVAKAVSEATGRMKLTTEGVALGTPTYMAPEQAAADPHIDHRADIYAVGAVAYELLTGRPPFTGTTQQEILSAHVTMAPEQVTKYRESVPPALAQLVMKCLEKKAADRWQSAEELLPQLEALTTPSGGITPTGTMPVDRKAKLRWMVPGAAVAVVAIVGLALWRPWVHEDAPVQSGLRAYAILADVDGAAPEEIRGAVKRLLASSIDASGAVATLAQDEIARGMESAMMPDTTRLTSSVARELAERGRIGIVFAPELDQVGGTYALTVRVLDVAADSVLVTERVSAADDDELIESSREVVDRIWPALAGWVGGEVIRPLAEPPVTASLEAYRKTYGGAGGSGAYDAAIARLREALEIDPEFAYAWTVLGSTYSNAGYEDSAVYAWEEALEYPERLTDYQRSVLEAIVSGDRLARFHLEERRYRETGRATISYANAVADIMGRYDDAVMVYEEMAKQSVFGLSLVARWNWASLLLALGRTEKARTVAEELEGTQREIPMKAKTALREREWAESERLALEIAADPARNVRWRSEALWVIASARAAQGRIREAITALHEMIEMNQRSGREEGHSRSHQNLLILTKVAGLDPSPWRLDGLQTDTTDRARVVLGLWAAESGDSGVLLSHLRALPALEIDEFDTPTAEQSFIAALHARMGALRGDWGEVVKLLEPVTGDRTVRPRFTGHLTNWMAAEAHEELGNLDSAADLYAGIAAGHRLGWDGVMAFGLTYSFAHRKAALLYGQLDQEAEAVEHWQAFLDAFTDPDPEFEWMVEEARSELERLGRGR